MGRGLTGESSNSGINEKHYPNVNGFLHRPLLTDPPMCSLRELQDGTYSLEDLMLLNELIDLKIDMQNKANRNK